jgi:hypothetical protein
MESKMSKETAEVDTAKQAKQVTVADKIWNHIKDEQLELFALPSQCVKKYCEPVCIEPTKLYLKFKIPAVLPALETALKGWYNVEMTNKYIVVSNIPNM